MHHEDMVQGALDRFRICNKLSFKIAVLPGLEIKVAFGGVWKQSLSELSGGQRSLLALSLILAMLLFKPAPIYILDEVPFLPVLSLFTDLL